MAVLFVVLLLQHRDTADVRDERRDKYRTGYPERQLPGAPAQTLEPCR